MQVSICTEPVKNYVGLPAVGVDPVACEPVPGRGGTGAGGLVVLRQVPPRQRGGLRQVASHGVVAEHHSVGVSLPNIPFLMTDGANVMVTIT